MRIEIFGTVNRQQKDCAIGNLTSRKSACFAHSTLDTDKSSGAFAQRMASQD
jgi:hypothetical protein